MKKNHWNTYIWAAAAALMISGCQSQGTDETRALAIPAEIEETTAASVEETGTAANDNAEEAETPANGAVTGPETTFWTNEQKRIWRRSTVRRW